MKTLQNIENIENIWKYYDNNFQKRWQANTNSLLFVNFASVDGKKNVDSIKIKKISWNWTGIMENNQNSEASQFQ